MDAHEYLKKPYARLVVPEEDGGYFAEIVEFPGCFATGQTATEALANVDEVAVDWINAAVAQGQEIPDPMDVNDYSGKLVLRMPKGLHKRAALWAEREGVSLNQLITTCLAEAVGERARKRSEAIQPRTVTYSNFTLNQAVAISTVPAVPGVTQGMSVTSQRQELITGTNWAIAQIPFVARQLQRDQERRHG